MSSQPRSLMHIFAIRELGSVMTFPLWWYTEGIGMVVSWIQEGLRYAWKEKAIGLWARNLLVPMYGDWSWSGRTLSIAMRIVVIIGRSIWLLVQLSIYLFLVFLWALLPLIAFGLLIRPFVF